MSTRRLMLVLAVLAAAAAAAAVPMIAPASRDRGEKLLIGFELRFTGPTTTTGTFHASGAVQDRGASNVTGLTLKPFGKRDKARLSGTQTFEGAAGTIVTKFKGIAHDVSQEHQYGAGRFRIVSGTGAYEELRGKGRFTIVVDGPANRLIGTERARVR
jgi:hypothetical protein